MMIREMIRQFRTDADLTRPELAEASGLSKHTIRAYEKGKRVPSVPSLIRIMEATGVDKAKQADLCAIVVLQSRAGMGDLFGKS